MVYRLLLIGSASIHTWRYLAGIAPYVGKVYLACNGTVPENYSPPNLAEVLPVDFSFLSWSTTIRLRQWIMRICPDMVHVHQANSVAWHTRHALSGSTIPLVLTAWGSDILRLPKHSALMRWLVVNNLKAATAITSDSLSVAAAIREWLGESVSIDVLNFGIDNLPPDIDLANKDHRVLSCRLHKKMYRIDVLLHAWREIELCDHFAAWSLTIAASGEDSDMLHNLAKQLQLTRVDFTGFIATQQLTDLYRRSRVLVSIPQSDATSISLLEGMGYGCLPVLSNLPANSEWVIDGLNGIIVESMCHLSRALATAMTIAENNTRLGNIARINRQLVADKAQHQKNMQCFADIYARLIHADIVTSPSH